MGTREQQMSYTDHSVIVSVFVHQVGNETNVSDALFSHLFLHHRDPLDITRQIWRHQRIFSQQR